MIDVPLVQKPPSPPAGRRSAGRLSVRRAMVLVAVLGTALALVAWFVRAIEAARDAARRSQCLCNLCQVTLALHNYHAAFGSFPPARVVDADGRPMHSWRVLILPYLEQSALYAQYDFREPWDGPNNRKLLGMMPNTFACPSRVAARGSAGGLTSYAVIAGPRTIFPDGRTVRTADITDGTGSTLMVAEVDNADIPWTEPRDLDVRTMSVRVNDTRGRPGISSPHYRGANVALADGGKYFLIEGIAPADLRALITIDGGEALDVENALSGPR